MKTASLKKRLFLAATIATIAALAIAGFGVSLLFERHVTRRIEADLAHHLRQLASGIGFARDGTAQPPAAANGDTRFQTVFSGLYWQVREGDEIVMTSRSLWDRTIPEPKSPQLKPPAGSQDGGSLRTENGPPLAAAQAQDKVESSAPSQMFVLDRQIVFDTAQGPRTFVLSVAEDQRFLKDSVAGFNHDLIVALGLLATVLIAAAGLQIHIGLQPLETVRKKVNAVRDGSALRLPPDLPREVKPLSEEINALLERHDAVVTRARNRAADLAHGLKTPLTALTADAARLRQSGQGDIADGIEAAAAAMNRTVSRELARARIRGQGHGSLPTEDLRSLVEPLIDLLKRTPEGERLAWETNIPATLKLIVDRTDFSEVLGNLLENAARHARSRVSIDARTVSTPGQGSQKTEISIADDGPGVAEEDRARLLERGRRLDTSGNGAGLGLAIVQDVMEAYGGEIRLMDSPLGGLEARLVFPGPAQEIDL